MNKYNENFYKERHAGTFHAAEEVLNIVQSAIPPIYSAVDVGCGVGSWLYVLQERGVSDVCGIDGPWVNKKNLKIRPEAFIEQDLRGGIELPRKFDLAISLEVAEHLPPASAESFVRSLTRMSDFVLFSAAIPGQGGTGHVNEQWQNYWVDCFQQQGYAVLDIVRKRLWTDTSIPVWYRQNIFLFVKQSRVAEVTTRTNEEGIPLCVVHPDLYTRKTLRPTLGQAAKVLVRSIKNLFHRS